MDNKLQGVQNSLDTRGLTAKSFLREAKQLKSYVHYLLKGEGEKSVLLTSASTQLLHQLLPYHAAKMKGRCTILPQGLL